MSGRVGVGDYTERAQDKKDCQLSFIVKTKIWAADSANSWYYNANGNMNNNNKNNSNTVRAVSEFHQEGLISLEDVFEAYYDCRKNKRNTANALLFEIDYERKLIQLWRDINTRTYSTSRSISFIINKPCKREIFAADFRDRIIHHLIAKRLVPIIEEELITNTFNNRVGKGCLYGIKQLHADIAEVSENYTVDCWVMKIDCKGFFMSLSKDILCDMFDRLIEDKYDGTDKDIIKWLTRVILQDCPTHHCVRKSKLHEWEGLDANKSLFHSGDKFGLPIGNLSSQMAANYYMNEIDHFVASMPGVKYGRFVDDAYLVSKDKQLLLSIVPQLRERLAEINVTLHPKKFYIQHYTKGVAFIGSVIKRERIYISNRIVHNAFNNIGIANVVPDEERAGYAEHFIAQLNSYLGFMQHCSAYAIRRNIARAVDLGWYKYIYFADDFSKVVLKKKHNRREQIKRQLRRKHRNGHTIF